MFARKLSIHLKPDTLAQFATSFAQDVVPLLRKQPGFKDEITFADAGSTEVQAISLWETQQNAEAYEGNGHKDVLRILGKLIEGTPKLGTTDVLHSTFHDIRTPVPVVAPVARPVAVVA
jgi:heme-degrading monooxygenase HmoA